MDIINSYCKPQQRADWENVGKLEVQRKVPPQIALEVPLRKVGSQNFDTIRPMND